MISYSPFIAGLRYNLPRSDCDNPQVACLRAALDLEQDAKDERSKKRVK